MLAAGLTPLEPYPGTQKPWSSLHECGREVSPRYHSIQQGQGGCSICARNGVDPEIAIATMLAAGLTPLIPYPGADEPWLCKHNECGREVGPTYHSIQKGRGGCPICARNEVDPEIAIATMLAAGLTPLIPYPGADEPWLCKHNECGREVSPTYHCIQQGQGGCSICAGRKVDLDIVATTMSCAGLTPLTPYPGAGAPWLCRHECGNMVSPTYSNVKRGVGCRFCSQHGYKLNEPGCVYLIESNDHQNFPHGVIKVGIAGGKFQRLKQWQQRGWTLLEVFHFDDGEIPVTIENRILKWLNDDLGLAPCLSADDVRGMNGHTETISVADLTGTGVTVTDVRKKVKQLVKKAGGQPSTDSGLDT
jgi:hypothetical protein